MALFMVVASIVTCWELWNFDIYYVYLPKLRNILQRWVHLKGKISGQQNNNKAGDHTGPTAHTFSQWVLKAEHWPICEGSTYLYSAYMC